MKRRLISVTLSIFAMLLLMGAANTDPAAALLAEEESAVSYETGLETEAQLPDEIPGTEDQEAEAQLPDEIPGAEDQETEAPEESEASEAPPAAGDASLLINGQPGPLELNKEVRNGTTYVSLSVMTRQLVPDAQISWDGSAAFVVTDQLTLTAKVGQLYVEANGRYLYVPETVQLNQADQVIVPLRVIAKAFGAEVGYDSETGVTTVTSGSGAIQNGEAFYNSEDLFWLSRVIYREAGDQSMKGKMAVGNVVLNRVADPVFPNTVLGVLAQKNQFTTYRSGALANANPPGSCVIAAKLVLDGGVVEETRGALFFDMGINSWASRNKRFIATLGDHKFYG